MAREDRQGTGKLQSEASYNLLVYRALLAGLTGQTYHINTAVENSYIQKIKPVGEEPYWSISVAGFNADDVVRIIMRNFAGKLAQAAEQHSDTSNVFTLGLQVKFKAMSLETEAFNTSYYRGIWKIKSALTDIESKKRKYKQLYMYPFFSPEGISKVRPEKFTTLQDRRDAIKESFWKTFNPILERLQASPSNFLVPVFSRALIGALFFNVATGWSHVGIREKFPPRGVSADEGRTPTKAQIKYANYRWSGLQMSFTEDHESSYWNISINRYRLPVYAEKINEMYHFWERFSNIIATRDFRREMYDNLRDILGLRTPARIRVKKEKIQVKQEPQAVEIQVEKVSEYDDIIEMLLDKGKYPLLDNMLHDNRDDFLAILQYISDMSKDQKIKQAVMDYVDYAGIQPPEEE